MGSAAQNPFRNGTKFHVIEYGSMEHQAITWQILKSQMRGFNPAAIMEAVFKL